MKKIAILLMLLPFAGRMQAQSFTVDNSDPANTICIVQNIQVYASSTHPTNGCGDLISNVYSGPLSWGQTLTYPDIFTPPFPGWSVATNHPNVGTSWVWESVTFSLNCGVAHCPSPFPISLDNPSGLGCLGASSSVSLSSCTGLSQIDWINGLGGNVTIKIH